MAGTTHSTWTLEGAIVGHIWQPGVGPCGVGGSWQFSKAGAPFVSETDTLRDAVDGILTRHGGDFQSCAISGDATFRVARRTYREGTSYPVYTERVRYFPASMFPSIADLLDQSLYASDFEDVDLC